MAVARTCTIPTDDAIGAQLSAVLRLGVRCRWVPGNHSLPDVGQLAVCKGDTAHIVAVAVADLGFVCRAGAALVMVPPARANEAVASAQVPDVLQENFREVLARMCVLLSSDSEPLVWLGGIRAVADSVLDPAAARLVCAPAKRRAFDVMIPRYGRGRIMFLFP